MRTTAASGLIALTAMLGVAASMTVAGPATAAPLPATAAPAKAPPPANQLYGVSCPSSTYCVAVGINENAEASVKGGGALIQT
jgi:putative hemolysin